MNVLHVSYTDLPGRRFDGYDLLDDLAGRGISGRMAVLEKKSDDPRVVGLYAGPAEESLRQALVRVETRHSLDSLLYPWGRVLAQTEAFRGADVVHYHIIQNRMVSLLDLPMLFAAKPSVWTFHDAWPFTGHCAQPEECEGWRSGCTPCPFLDRLFPLECDRAGEMWKIRRDVFAGIDPDIVVASEFMRRLVAESPITAHLTKVHVIPFGIDASPYLPDEERAASRRRLGIPEDHFVVMLRASKWELKGVRYALEALGSAPPARPTTVVTVDETGLVAGLADTYTVRDMGWVEDESLFPTLYSAADVFLMPSTGESFGMMALEAMAAGRPVVCFADTAVESVVHAPECGVAVPLRDARALRAALDMLASDPADAARRGALGRELASTVYDHGRYLDAMAGLYRSVAARRPARDAAGS